MERYGKQSMFKRLLRRFKQRKGYVLVNCSLGMIKELKGCLK